jgi:hypothetical protein
MSKFVLPIALVLSGMLCLTGCGGSDSDDSSSSSVAAPAAPSGSGSAPAAAPSDPSDALNAAFAAVTPSGIAQTDKFVISGRGSVFTVECSAISGAVSYTFTTSFGATGTAATPSVGLSGTAADGASPYTLSVYATNADGINTKTGSATVN